ncbi:head-tail joining protein [Neoroseomonas lacus]|uniref:Uncharacterized protein n=1 Tax=Neoroseomonas lacus TaxID=287609 RepID=A0A917KHE0_9PROT|nr:hypothetical protein [Neoroseomonas lacus]GGJ14178.1 hypothetical protein GCM10011320_21810 [Neoroseomonas lacus]
MSDLTEPFEDPFGDDLLAPAMEMFAVRVAVAPVGGTSAIRRGVFDRLHIEVGFGADGAPISASRSQIGVSIGEWGDPKQGDAIDVRIRRGRAVHVDEAVAVGDVVLHYLIQDVEHDGAGGALLILGARALSTEGAAIGGLPFTPSGQVLGS